MDLLEKFRIEIVIKKKKVQTTIPDWLHKLSEQYKTYESEDRLVFDLPQNWRGLKDGTLSTILKTLCDSVYIALVYIGGTNELVVDFDGNQVDKYDITVDGKVANKYVNKKLRVIQILDTVKEVFTVSDYMLDLSYTDCVVRVLDVYCIGSESKLKITDFMKGSK